MIANTKQRRYPKSVLREFEHENTSTKFLVTFSHDIETRTAISRQNRLSAHNHFSDGSSGLQPGKPSSATN